MQGVLEIQPGRMTQVVTALRSNDLILVENDVQNVANDLHEINPGLRLSYDRQQELWIVKYVGPNRLGEVEEKFVASYQECDQRIVHRMREINQPGYDFVGELDRLEREAEAQRDYEFREKVGPTAEKLAHALRQDLGRHEIPNTRSSRAVIPRAIPKG